METINECILSENIQNGIYNFYRESNLEVLEYLSWILPNDKQAFDFLSRYKAEPSDIDDQDTFKDEIFWEAMAYYGMTDIINKKESEL